MKQKVSPLDSFNYKLYISPLIVVRRTNEKDKDNKKESFICCCPKTTLQDY